MLTPMDDPRPLTTEPLALDLVNTHFIDDGEERDLLADAGGARAWLNAVGLDDAPATPAALELLRVARAAILHVLERRDDAAAHEAVNAVLAHGRVGERLTADGPGQTLDFDDDAWRAPWLVARSLLDLLRERPDRIRGCANEDCVLYFYDTSRGGRRQWCSMSGCGNRVKARRHYARVRAQVGDA